MKLRMLIVVFVVLSALPAALGAGKLATHVPLPADLQGELDGVPYRILVPENWPDPFVFFTPELNFDPDFTPEPWPW